MFPLGPCETMSPSSRRRILVGPSTNGRWAYGMPSQQRRFVGRFYDILGFFFHCCPAVAEWQAGTLQLLPPTCVLGEQTDTVEGCGGVQREGEEALLSV